MAGTPSSSRESLPAEWTVADGGQLTVTASDDVTDLLALIGSGATGGTVEVENSGAVSVDCGDPNAVALRVVGDAASGNMLVDFYIGSENVVAIGGNDGIGVASLWVRPASGETVPLLQCGEFGSERFVVGRDSIGFFGTAPVAKQTGVAVTAAALHAALVAYGLVAA